MSACYKNVVPDRQESSCDYLEKEQNRFIEANINKDMCSSFLNGLLSYSNGLKEIEQEYIQNKEKNIPGGYCVNLLSLNYTDSLSKLFNQCLLQMDFWGNRINNGTAVRNKLGSILFAHGDLNGVIVFGVDDEQQISCLKLFENCFDGNKRVLIKKEADLMIGNNYDRKAFEVL